MTPLHHFGDALRNLMLTIPLPAVRGLFLLTLVVLLIWVLRLPTAAVTPTGGAKRWDENLKVGAAVALLLQIAIYAIL
jgi:hypothetical protein